LPFKGLEGLIALPLIRWKHKRRTARWVHREACR
jgi:hypothetical protein